jgi:hypothetical protein
VARDTILLKVGANAEFAQQASIVSLEHQLKHVLLVNIHSLVKPIVL